VRFTGKLSACRLHNLYGLAQSLKEFLQILLENNDLMSFKIRFTVLFAFDYIQKNIVVPIFFDIEKICPPL
jgi:hypothetical protein